METYAIIITGRDELINLFCTILSEKYTVELYRNLYSTKHQLFDQINGENEVTFKVFVSYVNKLSDDISFIEDERGYKKCYKIYFSYDYNMHVSPSGYDFYMYWFDDCLMKDIRDNVEIIVNRILNKEEKKIEIEKRYAIIFDGSELDSSIFCSLLISRGYRVTYYDNSNLPTKTDGDMNSNIEFCIFSFKNSDNLEYKIGTVRKLNIFKKCCSIYVSRNLEQDTIWGYDFYLAISTDRNILNIQKDIDFIIDTIEEENSEKLLKLNPAQKNNNEILSVQEQLTPEPKKHVIIFDGSELALCVFFCALEEKGYRVILFNNLKDCFSIMETSKDISRNDIEFWMVQHKRSININEEIEYIDSVLNLKYTTIFCVDNFYKGNLESLEKPDRYDFYLDINTKNILSDLKVYANTIVDTIIEKYQKNEEEISVQEKEDNQKDQLLPIAQNIFDVDFLIEDAAKHFDIPKDTIIIGYGYPKIHAGSIGINLFISIGSNPYINIPTISYYRNTKLIESKYDGTYTTIIFEWVEQEYQPTLPEYEFES